jgi:hypothetical protein
MPLRRLWMLCLLVLAANTAAFAENIEEAMTPEEFKAAGLDKLDADELARLNAWLQRGAATAPAAAVADPATAPAPAPVAAAPADNGPPILAKYRNKQPAAVGAAPAPQDITEVNSRIVGYFEGWRKGTVFKLENGQHWRVTDDRRYDGPSIDGPAVSIKAAFMGSWLLKIEGYNRTARVQRVK